MSEPITSPASSRILKASVWVAIGALIAAAIVCVLWVLLGDSNGMVGRAFLTILLLVGFAGVTIIESNLAPGRAAWLTLASMASWIAALLVGAFYIWMPSADRFPGEELGRFFKFFLVVVILQGALLHIRLFLRGLTRFRMGFTTIVGAVTIGLVVVLAALLIIPLVLEEFTDFAAFYWRVVVAVAILAAVGTALVPLVNALFAPKRAPAVRPQAPRAVVGQVDPAWRPAPQGWPTYADGRTPLPVLMNGQPDWNAYYTGRPTPPQHQSQGQYAPQQPNDRQPAAPTGPPLAGPGATAPGGDAHPGVASPSPTRPIHPGQAVPPPT